MVKTNFINRLSNHYNWNSLMCSANLQFIIVCSIALIWRTFMFSSPQTPGYDESIYLRYAQVFGSDGIVKLRMVADSWETDETLNKGPLPLRIAYVVISSWGCCALGGYTIENLAIMSGVYGFITIIITYLISKRWYGSLYGFLATLILIFSPLSMALSQRALQDSLFSLVVILCVFFYDRYWNQQSIKNFILLGIVLSIGFLTKESMIFIYPTFILALFCYRKTPTFRSVLKIAIPFILAPIVSFAVLCWVAGGLSQCLRIYAAYKLTVSTIPYSVMYQGGSWQRYLVDVMILSPLPLIFSIIGAVSSNKNRALCLGQSLSVVYLTGAFIAFSFIPIRNVRFISFIDPFLCGLTVLGMVSLANRCFFNRRRLRSIAILLFLLVVIVSEIAQFQKIFKEGNVYDPVTASLISGAGFIRQIK